MSLFLSLTLSLSVSLTHIHFLRICRVQVLREQHRGAESAGRTQQVELFRDAAGRSLQPQKPTQRPITCDSYHEAYKFAGDEGPGGT